MMGTNFHGQKRSNGIYQSIADPEAQLYREYFHSIHYGTIIILCKTRITFIAIAMKRGHLWNRPASRSTPPTICARKTMTMKCEVNAAIMNCCALTPAGGG